MTRNLKVSSFGKSQLLITTFCVHAVTLTSTFEGNSFASLHSEPKAELGKGQSQVSSIHFLHASAYGVHPFHSKLTPFNLLQHGEIAQWCYFWEYWTIKRSLDRGVTNVIFNSIFKKNNLYTNRQWVLSCFSQYKRERMQRCSVTNASVIS